MLLLYAAGLLLVLFSPTAEVQTALVVHGADVLQLFFPDAWVTPSRVEVLMNVAIIAPVAFLGSIIWPRWSWQDWTAYGLLGSMAVELVQGVFLPDRSASFSDIVANAAGALVGALLHSLLMTPAPRSGGSR